MFEKKKAGIFHIQIITREERKRYYLCRFSGFMANQRANLIVWFFLLSEFKHV